MDLSRKEAARDAGKEPLLSSFLYASILSHDHFQDCLAFVLANRLSTPTLLATECYETFQTVFRENDGIVQAALADLAAVRERVGLLIIQDLPCEFALALAINYA